jgi:uncharacterized GH25 family protein
MRARLAAAVLPLLVCPSAAAHDFWIEPSTFRPQLGQAVRLGLRVGVGFPGDPVPRSNARIVKFDLVTPSGETPVPGVEMGDPAGLVRVSEAGLQIVGYRSNNARLDLPAEKFEQYLKEEGLEKVVAMRARRGESGKPSREHYSRCAKALLLAGAKVSGEDRPLGFTLELVAEENPYASAPGQAVPFQLLHQGKPLEGTLVVAIPRDDPAGKLQGRSDAKGRVTFRFPRAGVWLVKAVHLYPAPAGAEVDWESLWASLTFEIPEKAAVLEKGR